MVLYPWPVLCFVVSSEDFQLTDACVWCSRGHGERRGPLGHGATGDAPTLQVSLGLLEDTDYTNLTTEGRFVATLPVAPSKSSKYSCSRWSEVPSSCRMQVMVSKNWTVQLLDCQVSQIRSNWW